MRCHGESEEAILSPSAYFPTSMADEAVARLGCISRQMTARFDHPRAVQRARLNAPYPFKKARIFVDICRVLF